MPVLKFVDNFIDYDVEFEIVPETKGVWTLPNGDPGYPDEPAEVIITSVKYHISKEDVPIGVYQLLDDDIEKECWNLHLQLLNDPI